MEENKKSLPKLQDLLKDRDMDLLGAENDLNIILNTEPPKSWLKDHPSATKKRIIDGVEKTVPVEYIPIERVEWLMTMIFTKWWPEIKDVKEIAGSIVTIVKVHYMNPITGGWEEIDGEGASAIQKRQSGVMIASPASKSYAIKDAVECLGKIFGKDLNRADQVAYGSLNEETFGNAEKIAIRKKVSDALALCQDTDLHDEVVNAMIEAEGTPNDNINFYNEQLSKLIK